MNEEIIFWYINKAHEKGITVTELIEIALEQYYMEYGEIK